MQDVGGVCFPKLLYVIYRYDAVRLFSVLNKKAFVFIIRFGMGGPKRDDD